MPDHPKSTLRPPASAVERVFRETFLARFDRAEHAELLSECGDLLLTLALEAEVWNHGERALIPSQVDAAAGDLEHVARFLREVAESAVACQVSREELALCREAARWAGQLDRAVEGLRRSVQGEANAGGSS